MDPHFCVTNDYICVLHLRNTTHTFVRSSKVAQTQKPFKPTKVGTYQNSSQNDIETHINWQSRFIDFLSYVVL